MRANSVGRNACWTCLSPLGQRGTHKRLGKQLLTLATPLTPHTLQGKSTLTNWLLQDERCLTGPEPGLTRDAIKERIQVRRFRWGG